MSKSPWAEADLHRAFRREYDPSPSEKGNRRPPRGPGHVQHSLQSAAMSLPIRQGRRERPFAGSRLLYSADDPTRAGSARNAEHSEDRGRWPLATRQTCFAMGKKKTSPCAGLVGMLQRRALVRRPVQPLLNSSYPIRRGAEFQSGCHRHR